MTVSNEMESGQVLRGTQENPWSGKIMRKRGHSPFRVESRAFIVGAEAEAGRKQAWGGELAASLGSFGGLQGQQGSD